MGTDKPVWDGLLSRLENSVKGEVDLVALEELSRHGIPPDLSTEDRAIMLLHVLSSHARWQVRQGVAEILPQFSFIKVKDILALLRADSTRWVKQSAEASYKKLRVSSSIDKRDRKWDYTVRHVARLKTKYPEMTEDMRDDILKLCVKTGELYFEEVASQALHQVNTLTFVLSDAIETMDTQLKQLPKLPIEASKALEDIKARKENIETLFNSLMKYARPKEGHFTTEDAGIVLQEAIERAKLSIANTATDSIQWKSSCAQQLRLECDRERLVEALANLIVNAIEAMPTGGILDLAARPSANGNIQFIVSDTGPGMSGENFETNKRPGTTGKRKGSHSQWHAGLGLTYATKVIELGHEGQLLLEHATPHGTILIAEIPSIRENSDGLK